MPWYLIKLMVNFNACSGKDTQPSLNQPLLQHFKLEVDCLTTDDEAEVRLPEATQEAKLRIAVTAVDQQFNPEHAPELEHADAHRALAQADVRVELEVWAVSCKVGERLAGEMAAMRRIGVGSDVRVVRRVQANHRAGARDAVEFAHHGQHVPDVFDHLIADDQIELVVGKRVGDVIEIVNDISLCLRIDVKADAARSFMCATPDVENLHRFVGCSRRRAAVR